MSKILVVVDMQNDFITGVLGTKEAQDIVYNVVHKIKEYDTIILTQDTHSYNEYSKGIEGKNIQIHCIEGSEGWQFCPEVQFAVIDKEFHKAIKSNFGYFYLPICLRNYVKDAIEEIEIVGVCTDICVISNALILRSFFPTVPIKVDSSCCAGSTPEMHKQALEVMKSCQIEVI